MSAKEDLIASYVKGYRVLKNGDVIGVKGKKLKTRLTNKGYRYFSVRVNSKKKAIPVHRLVAYQKFGDELFNHGVMVRHLDNDKQNNSLGNIEIGSWQANYNDMSDKIRNKMLDSQVKSRKFTDEDIKTIRKLIKEGSTIRGLAERFDASPGTIQQIKERRTYKWVE